MQKLTEQVWNLAPPGGVFDETVVINLNPTLNAGARRAWVHRALKSGEVIQIRRGLYCLASRFVKVEPAHPFLIAEMIYWPSYVSFEMALHFHHLIPEHVTVVSCATSRRSKEFDTPVGTFSYIHIPCRALYAGVDWMRVDDQHQAQVASPLRAIADLIYCRKEVSWQKDGVGFLTESLRIDIQSLKEIDFSRAQKIIQSYKNKRVIEYIHYLTQYLKQWG